MNNTFKRSRASGCTSLLLAIVLSASEVFAQADLTEQFVNPPAGARPQVLWMWMGSAVSMDGITRDLEAIKDQGLGGATLFSLADVCTPWAGIVQNAPKTGIVTFNEAWWKAIRHAATESRRLGLSFGVHNCAGYETSGGPWITPELSMQDLVWSETKVDGGKPVSVQVNQPQPPLPAVQPFPVWNPETGKLEKPKSEDRRRFYRDIGVVAVPEGNAVELNRVVDLTGKLGADGALNWDAPAGQWTIYRFGHTTTGKRLQPAQWEAAGYECDKMNPQAVAFHLDTIIAQAKAHVGYLIGNGFDYYHFDSYESGTPGWTGKFREEFKKRRGYDLLAYLPVRAKRVIGSKQDTDRFKRDFDQTIRDLYRENYFPVVKAKLKEAGLGFMCEPYGGPWTIGEVVPNVDRVMTEFWTTKGKYTPLHDVDTVEAIRASGQNIIEAEAFTGHPGDSRWDETPAWLKPIGDAAFCEGVNRLSLHRYTHQPFDERWKPGMTMGQWGTHFDRTQTWWKPGKAWVEYLSRCQALLQWGAFVADAEAVKVSAQPPGANVKWVHRTAGGADVFFIANLARQASSGTFTFKVGGRRPELWNPVTGRKRDLAEFKSADGKTELSLAFAPGESYFVVFQKPYDGQGEAGENFPAGQELSVINSPWKVRFDPQWGGPGEVTFGSLIDWTTHADEGIRYYSGTANYSTRFSLAEVPGGGDQLLLDLGQVNGLAEVKVNGKPASVVWTAPWTVNITGNAVAGENTLEIELTNVWANRLIGDEQQPPDCEWNKGDQGFGGPLKRYPDWLINNQPRPSAKRFTFTNWNYFTKDAKLVPSGLLGPVRLVRSAIDRP